MSRMPTRRCAPWAALAASFVLTACGGGGGGSSASPTITATAESSSVDAGGAPVTLHATAGQPVSWSVEGYGSVTVTGDATAQYVPPAIEALDDDVTVTITARVADVVAQVPLLVKAAHLPGRHWTAARETSTHWRGVVAANGSFVAYGDFGRLATSSDSRTWTRHDPVFQFKGAPSADEIAGVAFAGGQWLAVGTSGFVVTSPDAATWTAQPPIDWAPEGLGAAGLVAGNGRFVLLANYATTSVSTDGQYWTPGTQHIHSATFGNGVFVGEGDNQLWRSTDGITWTSVFAPFAPPAAQSSLAFANGTFAAYGADGHLLTSADGRSWSLAGGPALAGLTSTPDAFWGVVADYFGGTGELYYSATGAQWDPHSPDNKMDTFAAIGGDADSWVRLSQLGSIERNDRSSEPWETVLEGGVGALHAVDEVDGRIIAVSEFGYALSGTGAQGWSRADLSPSRAPGQRVNALAIAHAGETVVVASELTSSMGGFVGTRFTVSHDGGVTWAVGSDVPTSLPALTAGFGRFVAVGGGGAVFASTDGATWTPFGTGLPVTETFSGVAAGNGRYVTVGTGGASYVNTDGLTWKPAQGSGSDTTWYRCVMFDGTRFLRLASDGTLTTSTDGLAWTAAGKTSGNLNLLAFSGGVYVAGGAGYGLFTSLDLATWRAHDAGLPRAAYVPQAVAATHDGFVAVGDESMILTSTN